MTCSENPTHNLRRDNIAPCPPCCAARRAARRDARPRRVYGAKRLSASSRASTSTAPSWACCTWTVVDPGATSSSFHTPRPPFPRTRFKTRGPAPKRPREFGPERHDVVVQPHVASTPEAARSVQDFLRAEHVDNVRMRAHPHAGRRRLAQETVEHRAVAAVRDGIHPNEHAVGPQQPLARRFGGVQSAWTIGSTSAPSASQRSKDIVEPLPPRLRLVLSLMPKQGDSRMRHDPERCQLAVGHEGADGFDATGGIEVHGHSVQGACRRMGRSSMMTAAGKPFKTWISKLGRPPLLLHYSFSAPCASALGAECSDGPRHPKSIRAPRVLPFSRPVRFGASRRMLRWRAAIPLRSIPLTTPKRGHANAPRGLRGPRWRRHVRSDRALEHL